MSKGIILYKSKYGSTHKYAEWLQKETGYDCMENKSVNVKQVQKYDTIIIGGGVYASGIAGLSFLKKNIRSLEDKTIIVFCVGASPYDEDAINQIRELHFKDMLSQIPLYYCRGAWNEKAMSFKDRTLCNLLKKAVAKQNPDTYEPWQKALMCAVGKNCDWTDKEYLQPLLTFLRDRKL